MQIRNSASPESPPRLKEVAAAAGGIPPSISVVICCHNSASRLPETLRHLRAQQLRPDSAWEIVVVDNASTDETVRVAEQFSSKNSDLVVRIVNEPRLGTAYARQRGITEARYELVLFVDDDNWLAPDYVTTMARMMQQHPDITALGGMSTAQCDVPEPSWLPKYMGWYALTGTANGVGQCLTDESFLWTAGTAFRRAALVQLKNSAGLLITGRRGGSIDAGEDEELSHLVRLSGGRLCRYAGLHFRHYLPAQRLTWSYLRKLHYGGGLVSVKLDSYRLRSTPSRWPQWMLRCWSAQFCNVCIQILRYRLLVGPVGKDQKEGNEHILRLDLYRGRLHALCSQRRSYLQTLTKETQSRELGETP